MRKDFCTALDIGCGMGRHVKYLDEMGFDVYGIDLSDTAISYGKNWFKSIGKEELQSHLIIGSVTEMPFKDSEFDFAVSHGVFDSMTFEIAKAGMKEAFRVLKPNALVYLDLISATDKKSSYEEVVAEKHEHGTIQSYYNSEKVHWLLDEWFDIENYKTILWEDESKKVVNARHHIIARRR